MITSGYCFAAAISASRLAIGVSTHAIALRARYVFTSVGM